MNLFIKQKQTYRHRKKNLSFPKGKGGRDKLGIWVKQTHTTIYKMINNKDLLYSTGDIQYLVITYNGKESEKAYMCVCIYLCIYICVTESLCCIYETNTTL